MLKPKFKLVSLLALYGFILFGIGYGVAILISNQFNYTLQDVMSIEGLLVIVIGVMLSMKGNSSGISLQGLGQNNAQYISNENLQVTARERESTNYYKNFFKHSVVKLAFSNITIIIGGTFIILFSVFCIR